MTITFYANLFEDLVIKEAERRKREKEIDEKISPKDVQTFVSWISSQSRNLHPIQRHIFPLDLIKHCVRFGVKFNPSRRIVQDREEEDSSPEMVSPSFRTMEPRLDRKADGDVAVNGESYGEVGGSCMRFWGIEESFRKVPLCPLRLISPVKVKALM